MIINNVKFLGSRLMPNPIEVDYWIDTRSDPYGSVIKYYNGTDWVLLNTGGGNGGNTDLTNYYTKSEVNTRLSSKADITYVNSQVSSVSLTKADKSSVYTKDEINSIVGAIPVFNESKYYTKVDIDNKGYLTSIPVEYITEQVLNDSIKSFVTLDTVYSKTEIDNKFNNLPEQEPTDLTGYATELWVKEYTYDKATVDQKLTDAVTGGTVDLGNYYTKQEVYNKTEIDSKFENLDIPDADLTGYATEQWVKDQSYITLDEVPQTDLSNYYNKGEVDELINNIEVPGGTGGSIEEVIVSDTEPTEDVDIWIDLSSTETESVVKDAPADGKVYGRQNNTWTEVVSEEPDLSNYYTKEESNTLLLTKLEVIEDIDVIRSNSSTAIQPDAIVDMETKTNASATYATKEELNTHATEAREYTDTVITNLVNAAPDTLDTLGELAQAILDNEDVVELLESSVTNKLDKTEAEQTYATKDDVTFIDVIKDGVYAVTAKGELINYNTADSSCLGVALIAGEHKFMIAKENATYEDNNHFQWSSSYDDLPINNYDTVDGTHDYLWDDGITGPFLNRDFTTWTNGALSDFNGKANTAVIAEISQNSNDMCNVLDVFNSNDTFNDWYVPAYGQLALMYMNKHRIAKAITNIGGTFPFEGGSYSSSSENGDLCWIISFYDGILSAGNKDTARYVRFIRDLPTSSVEVQMQLKNKVSKLDSIIPTKVSDLENDKNYVLCPDAHITNIQVLYELPESIDFQTLYLIPE